MPPTPTILWASFVAFVLVVLFLDLFVFSRGSKEIPAKRALTFTGMFVALALAFAGVIYWIYENQLMGTKAMAFGSDTTPLNGRLAVGEYLSVWMLEYAMSVDNLFVFTVVFDHFRISGKYQHRVLFWGIMGALILRGVMIGIGGGLVALFQPVLLLFGLILIWTGFKMFKSGEDEFDPSKSIAVKVARGFFPVTDTLDGQKFFTTITRPDGAIVKAATPMFLVLCVVEATDLVFAFDSIPAAFGQTREAFIIFTANVFAILGLRSLYFAIAGLIHMFKYLKPALAGILLFIGVKMLLTPKLSWLHVGTNPDGTPIHWKGVHLPTWVSLAVIGGMLAAGIIASLVAGKKSHAATNTDSHN